MNRLPSIIGPAPCELPLEVFMNTRIRDERKRIDPSLVAMRNGAPTTFQKRKARQTAPRKTSQTTRIKSLQSKLVAGGLSFEELTRQIEEDMKRG
jgi:hypothetical protein